MTELNTKFLPFTRPKEPDRCAFKHDWIRDWNSFFECLGRRISGISGPAATNHFEFRRRDSSFLSINHPFMLERPREPSQRERGR